MQQEIELNGKLRVLLLLLLLVACNRCNLWHFDWQRATACCQHVACPTHPAPPPLLPALLAVLTLLIELVLLHLETRTAAACRAVAVARLPECRPDGTLLRVLDTGQVTATRHAHCGRQIGRVCGKLVEDQSVAVAARLSRRQQQQRRQQQHRGEAHKGYFVAHSTAHTLQEIAGYTAKKMHLTQREKFRYPGKAAFNLHTLQNIYVCMYTLSKNTLQKNIDTYVPFWN